MLTILKSVKAKFIRIKRKTQTHYLVLLRKINFCEKAFFKVSIDVKKKRKIPIQSEMYVSKAYEQISPCEECRD